MELCSTETHIIKFWEVIYVVSKICLEKCVYVYSLCNRTYYILVMLVGRIMTNSLYLY